jgi:RNA polymerase-binding transcription factor
MDDAKARELLQAERDRIQNALSRLGQPVEDGEAVNRFDEADLASDLYQEEFDEGLEEDLREQLEAVARAEQRLAAGTYGISVESGEPIDDERLEAYPTAELTAEEARAKP